MRASYMASIISIAVVIVVGIVILTIITAISKITINNPNKRDIAYLAPNQTL